VRSLSKKKDFEYSGKLDEVKQTDDDLKNPNTPSHHPSNQPPTSNDNSNHDKDREYNNDGLNRDSPNVRQHNDDLEHNNVSPQPYKENGNKNGHKGEIKPTDESLDQTNEDLDNSNDENSNNNSDEDKENENTPQYNSDDNPDSGNKNDFENSTMNDEDLSDAGNKTDDDDIKQQGNDDNSSHNVKQQSDEDNSDDEPEQNADDSKTDDSSIKDKALNKIDPNLAKASKLKDLSKMNKEDAKEELVQATKSIAKKKLVATLTTYLLPIILPIIGGLLVILLFFLIMITSLNLIQNNEEQKDEGCSVVDKQSSNISDSKDAEKNAKSIFKYTKEHVKGSTSKGIAAWLGNIHEESGGTFSSSTIQGGAKYKEDLAKDPSAGGYALGFAQMDSERRVKLIKYAEKKDKKWSDMETQLEYILNHDGSDSDLIKKLVKKDSDISSTTEDIMNDWERAGAKDSLPKRQSAAKKYYSKFSKMDSDSDSNIEDSTSSASDNSDAGANSGCNDDSKSKTDGEVGSSVKANDKSGEIIEKWKSKDDIPKKYKKHISIPDFKKEYLKGSPFASNTSLIGQCTELTYAYMSAMWKGDQPTSGNGGDLYKSYESKGAKVTSNPTAGYGFSSYPPYAGAGDESVGHTGVVAGVLPDGKWIMANYNLNLEAPDRKLTYALVDGNKKKDGVKFFSGVGESKIKSK